MHALEIIRSHNVDQVMREMRCALAEDSASGYAKAQRIAKANPDLFMHDGQPRRVLRAVLIDVEMRTVLHADNVT